MILLPSISLTNRANTTSITEHAVNMQEQIQINDTVCINTIRNRFNRLRYTDFSSILPTLYFYPSLLDEKTERTKHQPQQHIDFSLVQD